MNCSGVSWFAPRLLSVLFHPSQVFTVERPGVYYEYQLTFIPKTSCTAVFTCECGTVWCHNKLLFNVCVGGGCSLLSIGWTLVVGLQVEVDILS